MFGSKTLRNAAIVEVVMGVVSLIATRIILTAGDASLAGITPVNAMWALVAAYVLAALQIVAGIIGVINAEKKSKLTFACGVLLFLPQFNHFIHIRGSVMWIIVNVVLLAVPYFYLMSANKNLQENGTK